MTADDIVLVPAFGTTVEIENRLKSIGIQIEKYDTTCPFVKKVWNMSEKLGKLEATVIVHGKHAHEETRATFSHSAQNAPTVVVKDLTEAKALAKYARKEKTSEEFYIEFKGKHSPNFNPDIHFNKVGVVNQTTMLAKDTHEIAEYFRMVMSEVSDNNDQFVDTRDTLCYATNDNQDATYGLLEQDADLAIVVGGYNSSNTSHLVELCEKKFPTFFISSVGEIKSEKEIHHFDFRNKKNLITNDWMLERGLKAKKIILTSGASCPDAAVDEVLDKILSFYENVRSKDEVLASLV